MDGRFHLCAGLNEGASGNRNLFLYSSVKNRKSSCALIGPKRFGASLALSLTSTKANTLSSEACFFACDLALLRVVDWSEFSWVRSLESCLLRCFAFDVVSSCPVADSLGPF